MWLRLPPNPHVIHAWHIAGIIALTGYANVVANQFLDSLWYIPFNLAILGVAVAIARHAGVTWVDMGMWRERIGRGLLVGGIIMGVIAVGIAIGVAIPATRELFYDDRVVDEAIVVVLFNALLRIPIATAFYEEMLFRGVLFGMFARKWAPLWAGLASSALFGLWHILPTIDTLDVNPGGDLFEGPLGIVVAGLLVGFGTQLGSGCTSGHGVCGIGRGSKRSIAATLTFMASGAVTIFVVRHVIGSGS